MIVIIADDFSGATELAGIAAARGIKAEVQTIFDPDTDAEVIAVDSDSRWRTEVEAARIVREITQRIIAVQPAWLYKKTDSVLRGHLRIEIEAILDAAALHDCILIPANPSKGRVIQGGRYLIEGVPLHETVFASDPDHPRLSSDVRELLGQTLRILTPDATTVEGLPCEILPQKLPAGAADFFTALLPTGIPVKQFAETKRTLLLCGSLAAWDSGRARLMLERGFEVKTLAETVSPTIWQTTSKLMLAVGRPEKANEVDWTAQLTLTALPLLSEPNNLRVCLEGGATAMAFIRQMGWTRFEVIPEGYTGVGTLRPAGGPILCVKPGSYPWPEGCLSDVSSP